MHRTLVSTDQLAHHLDDLSWVLVDCRYDLANIAWGGEQYRASHIPGAAYASLSHDLAGDPSGGGGRHPLPAPEAIAATFGRLGIAAGTQVVGYDQDVGMWAARLWWMLRYMGHDAVAVLDGGFAKWEREGRPTRSGPESRPAARFTGRPRDEMRRSLEAVAAALGDPQQLLIDARAAERFEGRHETLDRVAGHIPGARNRFFKLNVRDDGTFLPPEALRAQFSALLAGRPSEAATVYCGSGVTACHNLLAMEHASLRGARLFVGSWSEWSSDPSRPIETGTAGQKSAD